MNSQHDSRALPTLGKLRDSSHSGSQNEYKIEMNAITDETIQQIEELALSNACSGGIDIQNTINRIGILQFTFMTTMYLYIQYKWKSYFKQLAPLYS